MLLRPAVVVGLLAASAVAQIDTFPQPKPVVFTGAVAPLFAPLSADGLVALPDPTHQLVCNGALLSSEGIDLDSFSNGQLATWRGRAYLDLSPPQILIDTVEVAAVEFAADAAFQLGCPVNLSVTPGGDQQVWIFVALSGGFAPAGERGTWLLSGPFKALVNGASSSSPEGFELGLVLPDDPALAGLPLWLQAASRNTLTGQVRLSNVLCPTLNTSTQPCLSP